MTRPDAFILALYLAAALCCLVPVVLLLADSSPKPARHRRIVRRKPRARLACAGALLVVSAEFPIISRRPSWRTVQIGASA